MNPQAQKDIVSYELFAQMCILFMFASRHPDVCMRVILPSLSDSTASEATANKLYTSKEPVACFAQHLALMAWHFRVRLLVSHAAGEKNVDADELSRWDQVSPLPEKFDPEFRVRISISDIHQLRGDVRVWPADTHLLWTPPQSSLPPSQKHNHKAGTANPADA